jgi:hypothetical protein
MARKRPSPPPPAPLPALLNPLAADQRALAERLWSAPVLAPAPQKPCDVGLFSDDSKQGDLF